jgi:hypothetical protein
MGICPTISRNQLVFLIRIPTSVPMSPFYLRVLLGQHAGQIGLGPLALCCGRFGFHWGEIDLAPCSHSTAGNDVGELFTFLNHILPPT